jgi:hypothetical protein
MSNDGTGYWLAGGFDADGGASGVFYVNQGSTGAYSPVFTGTTNPNTTAIFNGQLYAGCQSAPDAGFTSRIFSIGMGTPQSTSGATSLAGIPGNIAPLDFTVLDLDSTPGVDTVYTAEGYLGVRKWSKDGGAYSMSAQFNLGAGVDGGTGTGCRTVAATQKGADVYVICATAEASKNHIVLWIDVGGTTTGAQTQGTIIYTAPGNAAFRGLAFPQ